MYKNLNLDGAEIHFLHCFYECGGIIVKDPSDIHNRELIERRKNKAALDKLLKSKDMFYISQAIEFGKVGLTYKMVTFSPKPVNMYSKKDMEKAFIAGGKLARNINNPSFDEFINILKNKLNDNRN